MDQTRFDVSWPHHNGGSVIFALSRRRQWFALLLTGGLATTGMMAASLPAAADEPPVVDGVPKSAAPADRLGDHDLALLAEARSKGAKRVNLIILTKNGRADEVTTSVEKLGGSVGNRNDRVGYVRASVPTVKVEQTAALPDVRAVDLNETLRLPEPGPEAKTAARADAAAPAAGPGAATPDSNPFMPTNETGAVAFKKAHPTWDGRGVTIGVLDSGVDLDNPAIQTTSTGERKIVDWVTATDPLVDGDPTWRAMLTTADGPSFDAFGESWTAPAGTFKVSRFTESITTDSELGGDVNRDGDTTDRFGVLYDPVSHDIRVDSDQNHDFTDNPVMRPYKEKFDVGHFGTDDPATAVRDQIPFVVEFREDVDLTPAGQPGQTADFVNIGIVEDAHGSHVTGIAAGNQLFGGTMNGAAPGAKVVSSRACNWGGGCTTIALSDGMVDLVANRGVDVVNMSIGALPALNDGNNARALLYNRLIADFGVELFISAGNDGPGVNTQGDPAVASDVVSSGASVSRDTWAANYGAAVTARRNMFNFSSRGPREDGGFKPDITAPGSAISTTPMWQPGVPVPEAGYDLPPGYAMFNGTSMASPQSAGAAALLLSAAADQGIPVTPANLRRAIYTAADYNTTVPAYAQGNGQFDVTGAWNLMRRPEALQSYTVSAPVCTEISQFLATPDSGPGIYNRCAAGQGGQAAGQVRSYDVTITRTAGLPGNRLHRLRWVGNDGTFSSARSVRLPLGQAVTVPVRARPSLGAHGALLQVDDPATRLLDHAIMNTVVASNALTAPSYQFQTSSSVQRNRTQSFFVTVPAGVAALQVNLSGITSTSQTRFIGFHPYGVPLESTSSLQCYTHFSDPATCNPNSRAYLDPTPGVWEIEVESRRTTPVLDNPFTLSAVLQKVTVDPAQQVLDTVVSGAPTAVSWTVTNNFAPVTITPTGGPLGSAHTERPTIADGQQQTFTVDVPAGASRLDVSIGNPSDLGADLDLTVRLNGAVVAQDADGDSEESVSISDPAPGTYTVEIDGFAVPGGTTAYDYRDVYFASSLGSLDVTTPPITLANGQSSTVNGTVTATALPTAGRQLFGELTLVTDAGAVIGRGGVLIQNVTPAPVTPTP